ncbi:HNH endonuclease family protein [Marinobacter sp.]|uniref:HNH endonuclease family protein n=1 Tax=Marinobacter sp. TaxID=50741 RepID=UPI003A95DF2F
MKRSIRIVIFLVVSAFGLHSQTAIADVVKMSSSGLCHPPQSNWYERTQNYRAFKSLDDCLDAGGKLAKGVTGKTTLIPSQQTLAMAQNYDRSAFGHGWDDADGDCQDSRAEALIATSTTPVRFATGKRCRVVTGRWISPFTNQVVQNASDIDIDHVVPLAWSWDRGAGQWSREKRERFANDPVNLWPVEASLNRSKGAKGPNEWLPPAGQCGYVARFYRIVKIYKLEPRMGENEWIRAFLNDCRS